MLRYVHHGSPFIIFFDETTTKLMHSPNHLLNDLLLQRSAAGGLILLGKLRHNLAKGSVAWMFFALLSANDVVFTDGVVVVEATLFRHGGVEWGCCKGDVCGNEKNA